MKPIKVVMSAFGSYGGLEEIDFTRVEQGIFLITGDTGAGKTTIFDAITYALFDETSGGKRDGEMMRSQYAADDVPTFVEYTFSYQNKRYVIRRNPSYRRISKRKNKEGVYTYTLEAASVELTMPDGMVFPGKSKETNEKIREILGVDVSQFTQICMIAQGEFLKLLHAPSKERKEIFSRIFDTKIYGQIQSRLKEQSKELYLQLNDNQSILEHELKNICCPMAELQEEWRQVSEKTETGKDAVLSCLHQIVQFQNEQEAVLQKKEQALAEKLDSVKAQTVWAKEVNRQFQRKQEIEESLAHIGKTLLDMEEKQKEWEKKQREQESIAGVRLPKLEQELAEAKNLLPKYTLLEEKSAEEKQLKTTAKSIGEQLVNVKEQEKKLVQEIEELQKCRKEAAPLLEHLPKVRQQEQESGQKKKELQNLQILYNSMEIQAKELKSARKQLEEALEQFEEKSRLYERYNRIFIEEQAGILAEALEEGSPCPVCGSCHHPLKAKLSEEAVTQKQVETAKEEREQAQETLDARQVNFQKQKEQWEGNRKIFLHSGQRLSGDDFEIEQGKTDKEAKQDEALQKCESWLQKALQECENDLKQLQKQRLELEEKQESDREWEKQLEMLSEQQQKLWEKKDLLQNKEYEARLAYETAVRSLQELRETLTYASREELSEKYEQLQQEKEGLTKQQRDIREEISALKEQRAREEGTRKEQNHQLELLKTSLEGKEVVELTQLQEKEQAFMTCIEELREQKLEVVSTKNCNLQAQEHLQTLYEERERLAEKYEVVETLSRTANGNLRHQIRLDLQTYVQRRYFKYIIREANHRLIQMSGGRFLLRCRELEDLGRQGEAGLDLDAYDLVTDQLRDVKTLSGGEAFLASLSMALGMADVIQKHAGKVHLDTMFIDEGFGTLDEESRGKAIGILQKLAGETRLVGIISHVTELKEQMDKKLMICKNEKGSHAIWQIEGE